MTRNLVAIILAAVLIAASLASCAVSPKASAISANIRLTSSDAESAAAWMTERLGDALTGEVVIGTDADGYDVDVDALDCLALAREAGSEKAVNIVLMGRLSHCFDLPEEAWLKALEAVVPPRFLELNRKAFALGRSA